MFAGEDSDGDRIKDSSRQKSSLQPAGLRQVVPQNAVDTNHQDDRAQAIGPEDSWRHAEQLSACCEYAGECGQSSNGMNPHEV